MFRSHIFKIPVNRVKNDSFNAGLYYYKYLPLTEDEVKPLKIQLDENFIVKGKKGDLLEQFRELTRHTDKRRLDSRLQKLEQVVSRSVKLTTASRFLCGVGYQSRMEWGFTFDWTTGIPYLPGSSFKGALLSYLEFLHNGKAVENWSNSDANVQLLSTDASGNSVQFTRREILAIFGPQAPKAGQEGQGKVVFFDVYPVNFTSLEVDVITPHYSKYYTNPNSYPPADIYNPVPQYFLTIPAGTQFQFMFRLLPGAPSSWKDKITALIKETGENFGFGAKTATGYGYFHG